MSGDLDSGAPLYGGLLAGNKRCLAQPPWRQTFHEGLRPPGASPQVPAPRAQGEVARGSPGAAARARDPSSGRDGTCRPSWTRSVSGTDGWTPEFLLRGGWMSFLTRRRGPGAIPEGILLEGQAHGGHRPHAGIPSCRVMGAVKHFVLAIGNMGHHTQRALRDDSHGDHV